MSTPVIIVILIVVLFVSISPFIDSRKARKNLTERLKSSWGNQPQRQCKPEDLESIATYFLNREKDKSGFSIDDITWQDLDLDDFFARLNSTETTAGEQVLYRYLRKPCFDLGALQIRRKLMEFAQRNSAERIEIQKILAKLGKSQSVNVSNFFYQSPSTARWKARAYSVLSAIALLSPLLLFVNAGLGGLVIALSVTTNMFAYYRKRFDIAADLAALNYIVRLVRCAKSLIEADAPDEMTKSLKAIYGRVEKIGKRGIFLFFTSTGSLIDVVMEYIKIVLLRELIDYESLCLTVWKHRAELIEIYDAVGLLDSAIAVASFRESIPFYCEPELTDSGKRLDFDDIYHPMLSRPVPNSLAIGQSFLVTGSNASGKSTFLKAVAMNAILAQSFHTCLARRYRSSMFAVFTSMALRDSTKNGESYFVAEIKSIKRILDGVNPEVPCLCLIDEILRGTNTVERIAASSQVLFQLAGQNCICIAATHDIELTFILENCYRNVHFQEAIGPNGIVFDYKLREGRAESRNAIKLLQLMGYGAQIVNEAEKRADSFLRQGSWMRIGQALSQ